MSRRAGRLVATVFVPAAVATIAIGCYYNEVVIEEWPGRDAGSDVDAGDVDAGDVDSDAGSEDAAVPDASSDDAGPSCTGDCVPLNPWNFSLPVLVWTGPPDQAPACPDHASTHEGTFYADLVVPDATCDACECKPSTGSCALPASINATAGSCDLGGTSTSFDPPANWDGSCSAANAIPAQAQCPPGSGIPCVQSLSVGALAKVGESCEPVNPEPPTMTTIGSPSWNIAAVVCNGVTNEGYGGCMDDAKLCVPAVEAASDFRHCVMKEGDHACDPERYPDKILVFEAFDDSRKCSACSCDGPPEDSLCTATFSAFKDSACTAPLVQGWTITSAYAPCIDLAKGQALGGKAIADVAYHPGACAPAGGVVEGGVELVGAITVCCAL